MSSTRNIIWELEVFRPYLEADRKGSERILMLPLKNNLARGKAGFAFRLDNVVLDSEIDTSKVIWEPNHATITVDQAMASEEHAERVTATYEAEEFLLEP